MLYQFVDYCGTVHDIRKAWIRHIKLFPGSARIGLHQQSNKHRRSLNLIKDTRGEISVAMHNQAYRDSSSNLHGHSPQQNKIVSLEKNYDAANDGLLSMENVNTRSNDTDMISLPIVESEDKAEDNARELPLSVSKEPRENDPEKNLLSADLIEVKEEAIEVKNFKKKWSESDISSENLLHRTVSEKQPSQALQASSNANAVFSQGKCELETEELKSLSMTGTSLNPWESTQPHSGQMTSQHECDTIPKGSKSNSRAIVDGHTTNQHNSASTQDSEPAQFHIGINRPYSTCHQDYRSRRPHLPPRYSRNSGGNLHSMRNAGKFHRGRKYGHRGYTPQKQHQQQQLSQQQTHQTEWGKQLPGTPACPQSAMQVQQCNQNQFQATATSTGYATTHSWPTQNIQIQNSLSQSQLPANTAPHVLQHAVQGNGQYGYMQNEQEYNLMWQQYYYQQQQLQLQQHYIQLEQQSIRQELPPQPEQHSQPEPLQPEQLQQLQLQLQVLQQQQYFQQQQPQQQEHSVYLQQLQPSTQV